MKNRIVKISSIFSTVCLVCVGIHLVLGVTEGYLLHGDYFTNQLLYLLDSLSLVGAAIFFACLSRIIELLNELLERD